MDTINMRPESWECLLNGRTIELTPSEATVLNVLVQAKGKVVTLDQLIASLWQSTRDAAYEHCLYNIMCRLRRKLGKGSMIRNRRHIGYKLEAEVES